MARVSWETLVSVSGAGVARLSCWTQIPLDDSNWKRAPSGDAPNGDVICARRGTLREGLGRGFRRGGEQELFVALEAEDGAITGGGIFSSSEFSVLRLRMFLFLVGLQNKLQALQVRR